MIFVIVPAHNEEKSIGRVIGGLFKAQITQIKNGLTQISGTGRSEIKVVVVDDGSSDNTAQVALEAGAIVLRHEVNRGQGAALQTGNEYALARGAEIVVHFDADGQFNPADISGALKALAAAKADILLGSRFLDNRSSMPWTKRYLVLPISRFINKLLTGLRLSDVHNGFRVLTRRALEKLHISQDRMAHNSEIVQQIKKHNLSFIEHPVEVKYFEYGQGISGGFKILLEILQQRLLK